MKKFFFLFFLGTLIGSCSTDYSVEQLRLAVTKEDAANYTIKRSFHDDFRHLEGKKIILETPGKSLEEKLESSSSKDFQVVGFLSKDTTSLPYRFMVKEVY